MPGFYVVWAFGRVAKFPIRKRIRRRATPRCTSPSDEKPATIVNGRVNVFNGEQTGVRAGAVLRHVS
jgi:N-acyl-D-aspartate/D-glutamate deacylase